MSNTRKVLDSLDKGYKGIGKYICAPFQWAQGEYDSKSYQSDNVAGAIIEFSCDLVKNLCKCCLRTPCCCVGTAVTVPTGIAAAGLLSAFGCLALSCAAVSDAPSYCKTAESSSAPPAQTMS